MTCKQLVTGASDVTFVRLPEHKLGQNFSIMPEGGKANERQKETGRAE